MLNNDDLKQLGELIDQKLEPVKQSQAQIKTVVEALAAGQAEIKETSVKENKRP